MRLNNQLVEVLRSIVILSPAEFSFAGECVSIPQAAPVTAGTTPQMNIVTMLQMYLYQYAYSQKFTGALKKPPETTASYREISQQLSAANTTRERWDTGWQVVQVAAGGMIYAQKQSRVHMFFPGQYVGVDGSAGMPQAGSVVNVFLAKDSTRAQPGFYIAFGDVVPEQADQLSLLRFYWNVTAESAVKLVGEVTRKFNRFEVPFRMKCLAYAEIYDRFDSGVLFIGRRHYQIAAKLIEEAYEAIRSQMNPETPLFTRQLAPGLGFAEDPGTGDSFGNSRCTLVAQGIWSAYMQGLQTEQVRLREIGSMFTRAGLDVNQPWLNAGTMDAYEFPTSK